MNLFEEQAKADQEAAAIDKQNREYLTNLAATANKNGGFPSASEAAAIEERRKQAQIAEQSHPFATKPNDSRDYVEHDFGFPQPNAPAKRVRPDDKEIIEAVQAAFGVSYGTSCDWILEVAENLAVSP